ncbi:MAG: SDR family oxidoreductase [Peptococcaceae bacterium]|nr:SDR family oxidoreductase [Peptococcaceae bacterium]
MNRLEGKVALITGAGSGIGRGTALMFAKEGAKVIATSRSKNCEETERMIREAGGDAHHFICNVRNKDEIEALVKFAMEKYGRIDVLVNNAGVLVHKPFLEHNDEDLATIYETNFRAYIWTMQAIIPIMIKQGKGSIINVASISAVKPETNAYYYGAFKAGMYKLTKDIAREFSPQGIRLNLILPGPIQTNLTPKEIRENPAALQKVIDEVCLVGRAGYPDDIAYGAVYLASDESSFVTGTALVIDGGACVAG